MALLDLSYLCFTNASRVLSTSRVVYQLVHVTHSNLRSIAKKNYFNACKMNFLLLFTFEGNIQCAKKGITSGVSHGMH